MLAAALAAFVGPDQGRGREARAQDAKPPVSVPVASGSGPQCVIKGTYPGPKGTSIFDAASGGRAVAGFSGALQAMLLSDLPSDPTAGRAKISTSLGSGALRIDGWVSPGAIAVFTARDVPIAAGHVWISETQRVKLVQAASGTVTAELTVLGGSQTVRASAPCDAFALQHGTPAAMEVPGNGRGYLSRGTSIDLFDAPGGTSVFSLKVSEGTAHLFWSTESRAGFVHVRGRSNLTIDAWARLRDLEPLKKGEMMDQFVPPTTAVSGAQLSLDRAPRVVQATREIPIRARRDDKEKPIGAIEIGAEVFLMETMVGWVNVLPKNLGLTPADEGGFWIPASDAPK